MTETPIVRVSFKDMDHDDQIEEVLEKRCSILAEEFPEINRFEITLSPDGSGHTAHGRVTGRNTEIATHANAIEAGKAADQLLDKLTRQLRKSHDKKIFVHRREGQRAAAKHKL